MMMITPNVINNRTIINYTLNSNYYSITTEQLSNDESKFSRTYIKMLCNVTIEY